MICTRNYKSIISVFIKGKKGRSSKGPIKRPDEYTTL